MLAGSPAAAVVVDRIAAVVNDEVVTLSEIYDLGGEFIDARVAALGEASRAEAELEVLDSLVMRSLVTQEISRLELQVAQVELDRAVDDIARRNGMDRDTLKVEVERSGLPWDDYLTELGGSLEQAKFSQAVIRPRISVNEDELLDAYRRMVATLPVSEQYELGAIFLSNPPDATLEDRAALMLNAQEAAARVVAGESFEVVAVEVDQGPYGAKGGHMGLYRKGELVAELDEVAFSLGVGEISAPIETPQGIFLLYVFDRLQDEAQPFESVREELFERVYSDRIDDETEQWYQQARRRASVIVKLTDNPAL
ncbi:MAG: peptidylprolyl isomerase [Myxococcota bacterium]|nr:peptidylprolyl isomerase [Myxococcota bacterium]